MGTDFVHDVQDHQHQCVLERMRCNVLKNLDQVARCIISGSFLALCRICCFVLRVFLVIISANLTHILTVVFQVKITGSGRRATFHSWAEQGSNWKKQPFFFLVDLARSHLVHQCVTHTEACEKPIMHSIGPFSCRCWWDSMYAFIWGCSLPCERILYVFRTESMFEFEPVALNVFHDILLQNQLSCLLSVCVYYMCVWMCVSVCLVKRVRCFNVAAAKRGRQRKPRPQRGCKWE